MQSKILFFLFSYVAIYTCQFLGSLVYQLLGGVTLAYDLCLGSMVARWKGIDKELHFGGSMKTFEIQ
jgi:hypothetical protein